MAIDFIHRRPVARAQTSAQRVCQHLLHDATGELGQLGLEDSAHFGGGGKAVSVGQDAGGIDGKFAVHGAPLADAVVVLQAEAERVHLVMAGGAHGVGAVLLHLLAQGGGGADGGLVERRNVGRRRRRRAAQNVVEDVLSADDDRGTRGVAGDGEHAGVAEDAAALGGGELDAAEVRPLDACDAVMFGQALIEEGVAGVEELAERAILAQDGVEEEAGLLLHGVAQLGTPIGELLGIGFDHVEVAQFQPLAGEVIGERGGARVGEQALHLGIERGGGVELAALGEREQFVVRHPTPQEVAEARGQLDIGDRVGPGGVERVRVMLDAEEEVGGDKHGLEGQLNSLRGGLPVGFRHGDELEERGGFGLGDRAAPGMMGQVGDDLCDAGGAGIGIADEDLGAAGRRGLGSVGADEGDGIQVLVFLAVVGVLGVEAFDEFVVEEGGAEDVIALGEEEAHLLFGVRIEVDQFGWLGFDGHGVEELAVHPESEHHGLGVGRALAGETEADDVNAIEFDAAAGLDGAEIDAADFLVLVGVLGFERFG